MWEKGVPRHIIFEELKSRLERDFSYKSGKIIGSMCTLPHPLAKEVFSRFLEKNLGDSGLFPATAELERESVKMLGSMLSNPKASGRIVTGGTEANILALWAAKKLAGKNNGEVIVLVSAHYSFDKAADLLGLKLIKIGLNKKFQVKIEDLEKAVSLKTIAMVGIAGTTELGIVDPIERVSEIAVENNLYLHIDAAFGGFVLPFLRELGFKVPEFDFKLPGVNSITVDPHKMGMAPVPAGGILFRNSNVEEAVTMKVPYLAGGETSQSTLVGSRSGASIIAVWALLKHLGKEGYRKVVGHRMRLTRKLASGIKSVEGLDVVTEPVLNVVGLKSDVYDIRHRAAELRAKGWAVSLFPKHIRIVVMPHVQEEHVKIFLEDLREISENLKVRGEPA